MRRSGKTFRALMTAFKLASEGRHVMYECPSNDMAKWTCDKAMNIIVGFMEPVTPERRLIKIGEGSIRFVREVDDRKRRLLEMTSKKYVFVKDLN